LENALSFEREADFAFFDSLSDPAALDKCIEHGAVVRQYLEKEIRDAAVS
jgi:hypothetical protein